MPPVDYHLGMGVDRCVCLDVSFASLIALHRDQGLGLEQLKDQTGCCTGCTTCEPYVRLALQTGRAVLPVLSPAEQDRIMREPTPPAQARDGAPAAFGGATFPPHAC